MPHFNLRSLLAAAFLSLPALASAAPVPLAQLFAKPQLDEVHLSPDGRKLVMVTGDLENRYLLLHDLTTGKSEPLAYFNNSDVGNLWWKGNDLLLLLAWEGGAYHFSTLALATKKVGKLTAFQTWGGTLIHDLPEDPDSVLVSTTASDDLYRLNCRTNKLDRVAKNPARGHRWFLNRDRVPVGLVAYDDKHGWLHWRTGADAPWQKFDLGPSDAVNYGIAEVHTDQRRFLAWDYTAKPTAHVVALDPATGEKTDIFSHPEVDPGDLIRHGRPYDPSRGVAYEADKCAIHFFDSTAASLQAAIDAALPATRNDIVSRSLDDRKMVILGASDRDAGAYYLLDRTAGKLALLGRRYPAIDPKACGPTKAFSLAARDGLRLHGHITLPPDAHGPVPVVVKVAGFYAHDRSSGDFNILAQIFATRGYAFAEVDFRGTRGFGRDFVKAGDYQMAKGMPDDLEDAIKWLVEQHLVDPQRVGVFGAGYGGVVAMHALSRPTNPFSIWLNWTTALNLEDDAYSLFSFSTSDDNRSISELGGTEAARQFRKSIAPATLLPAIKIPSCHYYAAAKHDKVRMRKLLKTTGAESRFIEDEPVADHLAVSRAEPRAFEEMLKFLVGHLPPAGAP